MPRSASSQSTKSHTPPTVFKNPYSSVANTVPAQPTFGQTLKDGLAFGTGQAFAHRMVGSLFGTTTASVSQKEVKSDPCEKELLAFQACLKSRNVDDFCGAEQISYKDCLQISNKSG